MQVRASPLRRQHFEALTTELYGKIIQLVRDVDIRWSSTFLMLDCALRLREVSTNSCLWAVVLFN